MFTVILHKEIMDHILSLRFAVTCLLCFFVMLASFTVRSLEYEQVLDDYNRAEAIEWNRLDRLENTWHLFNPITVHRSPNPLKILVRGCDDQYGGTIRLEAFHPIAFAHAEMTNPTVLLFPTSDLVIFVGVIMSLVAIVFGYDAVCGEKQQGTLRLMLSYPVPRDVILLAKWLGGYVTMIIPFLFSIVGMVIILLLRKTVSFSDDQWLKLAGILILSLLYLAAVYSVAICISCFTGKPATSMILLLTVWVVLFLAVPCISPYLAQSFGSVNDLNEIKNKRRLLIDETLNKEVYEPMKAYEGVRPWYKRVNAFYELYREAYFKLERDLQKLDDLLDRRTDRQIAFSRWLARISPYGSFAIAAAELADEGVEAKQAFLKQAAGYHSRFMEYAYDEHQKTLQYYIEHDTHPGPWFERRTDDIPRFTYQPGQGISYLGTVAVDFGLLAGMAVLFFMISYMKFLRYDVR